MSDHTRSSGIMLHPASLPGRFGIGEIGPEAQQWLEYLSRMGQSIWHLNDQSSPLPIQIGSAGNVLLLSFDALRNDGVLLPSDLALLPAFDKDRIDLPPVIEVRMAFLRLAARRFLGQANASPLLQHAFDRFCDAASRWLETHALSAALKVAKDLDEWKGATEAAMMPDALVTQLRKQFSHEIDEQKALQFLFFRQWHRLRASAHDLGIRVLVDTPEAADRIGDIIEDREKILATELSTGWEGIENGWRSESNTVLCPAQAVVDNTSPTATWRLSWDSLTSEKQLRLRTLTAKTDRL